MSWLKGKKVPLQIGKLVDGDITGGFVGDYIVLPLQASLNSHQVAVCERIASMSTLCGPVKFDKLYGSDR